MGRVGNPRLIAEAAVFVGLVTWCAAAIIITVTATIIEHAYPTLQHAHQVAEWKFMVWASFAAAVTLLIYKGKRNPETSGTLIVFWSFLIAIAGVVLGIFVILLTQLYGAHRSA